MTQTIQSNTSTSLLLVFASFFLVVSCASETKGADRTAEFKIVKNATCPSAWEKFKAAKFQEAIDEYKSVIANDPKSANGHYGLACCYMSLDRDNEALAEFEKAHKLNPEHTGVYNDRANLYSSLGRYEDSIKDSTIAIRLEDWNASNHNDRAGTYYNMGKYDLALKDATNAVIRDGEYVNPHFYRGLIFYRKDQYKKALIAFRFALDCEPTYHLAHNYLGHIYFENDNFRKAIDHYTQALTLDPVDADYYMFRAEAYKKLGKLQEAESDFKQALRLDPNDRKVKKWQVASNYKKRHSTLSKAQLFAIGCAAVLDRANGANHELLVPYMPNQRRIEKQKKSLKNWWGITSGGELVDKLNWIDSGGHRKLFEEIVKALDSGDEKTLRMLKYKWSRRYSQAELNDKISVAKKYSKSLSKKSLLGWDYCRYINLCRWSYMAGYITEDEAWRRIMPVAKKLQNTFDSWDDLGRNYLIGRRFWNKKISLKDAADFNENLKWLNSNPDSPWVKTAWDTKLN